MDGIRIENVSNVKHLGHILTGDLLDSKDIIAQTAVYNRKANAILSDFKYIASQLSTLNYAVLLCTRPRWYQAELVPGRGGTRPSLYQAELM